jgi:neutral ceramidase
MVRKNSDSEFHASVVEIDITPPVGARMEGYSAREGVSEGVHDPLLAQLLMLQADGDPIVLISLDLLGVNLEITESVRRGIAEEMGIPAEAIMLACSHTHSGPAGFLPDVPGLRTHPDPEFRRVVERKIVGAAREAAARFQPATVAVGTGHVRGVGANRNDPEDGPFDDELIVMRVDGAAGQPLAVLMCFGCHPTVMGHENLLFTADFPGAARRTLSAIYPETTFLFANGTAGDISARFTRREQTFAEVERLGRILAGEVLKAINTAEPGKAPTLGYEVKPMDLPLRDFPSSDEAQARIERLQDELDQLKASGASHGEIRQVFTQWQGAVGLAEMAETLKGRVQVSTQVQRLRIGDLTLVGLPGEPFTRIGLKIKEESPFRHTVVLSYCNDEVGYFPDRQAYTKETYEALISPYPDDVAEIVIRNAQAILGSESTNV